MQPFGLWQTLGVFKYTDSLAWLLPLTYPCLLYLAAVSNCDFWAMPSWIHLSRSSPAWSFFRPHSNFLCLAPSLPPTPVALKNLSSSATAFSFASKSASHLLSARACHKTPFFSSSLTSFLRSFLHLWHLVYKCPTDCTVSLHHQHSGDSITPILAKMSLLLRVLPWAGSTVKRTFLVRFRVLGLYHPLSRGYNSRTD